MSLQTVFPDVDVCHHDFFEMTSPENEWDPQSKIPEVCGAIQQVYSLGAIHYTPYHLELYVTSTGECVPELFP